MDDIFFLFLGHIAPGAAFKKKKKKKDNLKYSHHNKEMVIMWCDGSVS